MKKLLVILIPLFVCIAVLFKLQARQFDFIEFLNVVSEWDFEDSLYGFVLVRNTLIEVGEIWTDLTTTSGFWNTISLIGDLLRELLNGYGLIFMSVAGVVVEFVDNVIMVVEYLFFYSVNF